MGQIQTSSTEESNVSRLLRRADLRVTSQRALLLEIIRDSAGHLDADEIYRLARDRHPRLSLSTVYRTLGLLKEMGLVRELDFDEDHRHYELCDASECKHYHIYCLSCGTVIEFESSLVPELTKQLAQEHGFEIVDCRVLVSGYCAACQARRATPGGGFL